MSNALEAAMPNAAKVSKAVTNIRLVENGHREFREKQEAARREAAIKADRQAREEVEAYLDDETVDAMIPKIIEVLSMKPWLVGKGYNLTVRNVAHLLPEKLHFTVRGLKILHRALAMTPGLALLMAETWKVDVEVDLRAAATNEEERKVRNAQIENENAEIVAILRGEIVNCLRYGTSYNSKGGEPKQLVRNYSALFHHLRNGINIHGLRAVKLIHEAMNAQLDWAPHWEAFMLETTEKAQIRENEFRAKIREKKAAEKKANRDSSKKFVNGSENEAVREMSESEWRAEEERAHEFVREELEKTDPANPETNPPREGYVITAEEAQEDMDSIADEIGGSAEQAKNFAAAIADTDGVSEELAGDADDQSYSVGGEQEVESPDPESPNPVNEASA